MSTLKTNAAQIGQSATATNNFTLYQPTTPDGTVRLAVGNAGSTTDALRINSTGQIIAAAGAGTFNAGSVGSTPLFLGSGSYGGGIGFLDGTVTAGIYTAATGTELRFFTGMSPSVTAASVEKFRIDGSGRVTMPYQPAFVAYMNTNHSTTTGGKIPFNVLSSEVPSVRSVNFDTTNNRFTAPVSGLYQFSIQFDFGTNYTNYYFWIGINGGGRDRDFFENVDVFGSGGFFSTFYRYLSAGDYVQVHSGTAGLTLNGGNATYNCIWQGALIG